jgi:hypothetical protein
MSDGGLRGETGSARVENLEKTTRLTRRQDFDLPSGRARMGTRGEDHR